MSGVLRLPASVVADLRRWAGQAYPAEGCGLLVGRRDERSREVVRATLAPNLRAAQGRDRYEVDPAHHLAVWKAAEREGLEVVGAWHSHPDQGARPSDTDRREAWEGLAYVIVAVDARGALELRAWGLVDGALVEQDVQEPLAS